MKTITLQADVEFVRSSNYGKAPLERGWVEPGRRVVPAGTAVRYEREQTSSGVYHVARWNDETGTLWERSVKQPTWEVEHYLGGYGAHLDAIFSPGGSGGWHVVVERGMTNCVDEVMNLERAKALWAELVRQGWYTTDRPRVPLAELRRRIRD